MGTALLAGVREALAALRSPRGRVVEDGRDRSRTMNVPVPRRRQIGPNGRFLSQPERREERAGNPCRTRRGTSTIALATRDRKYPLVPSCLSLYPAGTRHAMGAAHRRLMQRGPSSREAVQIWRRDKLR